MILLYVFLFIAGLYFVLRKLKQDVSGKRCPGPRGLPLVGNFLQYKDATMFLKLSEWAKTFGPIYEIDLLGQRTIVLNSADIVRKAMSGDSKFVFAGREKSFYGEYVFNKSESMTFTNDMEFGSTMRKAFTQGLHIYGDGIKAFEDIVMKENVALVKKMKKYEGEDFSPNEMISVALGNIISVLLIGKPINETDEADDVWWRFSEASNAMLHPNVNFVATSIPFLRFIPSRFRRNYVDSVKVRDIFRQSYFGEMKETFVPGKTRGLVDFMYQSQLDDVAAGSDVLFTDERILNIFTETVAAGFQTSTATLWSIVLCLIHDQKCQQRVYEEVLRVIGTDAAPTTQQRKSMPYLEAVVYESLRYAPPVPLSLPHQCNEDVDFEGYRINKGDQILINVWHIHHNEEVYEDPYEFRPERFLDEQGEMLSPSHPKRKSWFPFSIGRRQCVGENLARSRIFLLICSLIQKYRFLPPRDGNLVNSDPRTYTTGVVHHPNKFTCRIESR